MSPAQGNLSHQTCPFKIFPQFEHVVARPRQDISAREDSDAIDFACVPAQRPDARTTPSFPNPERAIGRP